MTSSDSTSLTVSAQGGGVSQGQPRKATPVNKTPWGDPDLQGIWTNTTTTPLERLPEAGDKAVLTDEERADVGRRVAERLDQDRPPARAGQVVPYNEFW